MNPVFEGRRVLVTGHLGFKGAWLAHALERAGAEVWGLGLPTPGGLGEALRLSERVRSCVADVRDPAAVAAVVAGCRPDVVFHLAAQPLVRASYADPTETWSTNVMGTLNVLEALRAAGRPCAVVAVTTDKCYENQGWHWGYRETDPMGGHDPYSASKGAAELLVASWRRSYPGPVRVATGRAGNVIGGGDFSADRLVPDLVRAVTADRTLRLRNPGAVRHWIHVLDVLHGYTTLAARLLADPRHAEGWNFAALDAEPVTVAELAARCVSALGRGRVEHAPDPAAPHEEPLLRLDSSKAVALLGWRPRWGTAEAVAETMEWYRRHADGADPVALADASLARFGAFRAVRPLPYAASPWAAEVAA